VAVHLMRRATTMMMMALLMTTLSRSQRTPVRTVQGRVTEKTASRSARASDRVNRVTD